MELGSLGFRTQLTQVTWVLEPSLPSLAEYIKTLKFWVYWVHCQSSKTHKNWVLDLAYPVQLGLLKQITQLENKMVHSLKIQKSQERGNGNIAEGQEILRRGEICMKGANAVSLSIFLQLGYDKCNYNNLYLHLRDSAPISIECRCQSLLSLYSFSSCLQGVYRVYTSCFHNAVVSSCYRLHASCLHRAGVTCFSLSKLF